MSKSFRFTPASVECARNGADRAARRAALQKPKAATRKPMGKSEMRRFIASKECANSGYGLVDRGCYDFKEKTPGRRVDSHAEHVAGMLARIHTERAAVVEAA